MRTHTTAERLREILARTGLRQADLLRLAEPYGREYGVTLRKSDISQYVSGKVVPSRSRIAVLSRALGVSEVWLMGYDADLLPLPATRELPILGSIACGEPLLCAQESENTAPVPEEIRADFCLRCRGDSMSGARICDGDIVYIRRQDDVDDGQIAAVLIGEEATLKRVYHVPGGCLLQPENPNYRPMLFTGPDAEQVRILGLAVAFTAAIG